MQNVATAVAVALAVAVSPHRQEATPDSASVVDWRRGGWGWSRLASSRGWLSITTNMALAFPGEAAPLLCDDCFR